ncbi:hypothetical protein CRUP_014757, partial [Coryphaenoides rupestris]
MSLISTLAAPDQRLDAWFSRSKGNTLTVYWKALGVREVRGQLLGYRVQIKDNVTGKLTNYPVGARDTHLALQSCGTCLVTVSAFNSIGSSLQTLLPTLETDMQPYECYDGALYVLYERTVGKSSFTAVNTLVSGAPSVAKQVGGAAVTVTWNHLPRGQRGGCVRNYSVYIENYTKDTKDKRIYIPDPSNSNWAKTFRDNKGKMALDIYPADVSSEEEEQIVTLFEQPKGNGEDLSEGVTYVSSVRRPELDSGMTRTQTPYIKSLSQDTHSSQDTSAGYMSQVEEGGGGGGEREEEEEEEEEEEHSPWNIFDSPQEVLGGMLTLDAPSSGVLLELLRVRSCAEPLLRVRSCAEPLLRVRSCAEPLLRVRSCAEPLLRVRSCAEPLLRNRFCSPQSALRTVQKHLVDVVFLAAAQDR